MIHSLGTEPPKKIHLACGNKHLDGFINIDIQATEATDLVDEVRRLQFQEGEVGEIFFAQTIQFFRHEEIQEMLKKFHHWLRADGRATIILPDFDRIVVRYIRGEGGISGVWRYVVLYPAFIGMRFILGRRVLPPCSINGGFSGDIVGNSDHYRSIFNARSFIELAGEAGFTASLCDVDRRLYSHHWSSMAFELKKQSYQDGAVAGRHSEPQ